MTFREQLLKHADDAEAYGRTKLAAAEKAYKTFQAETDEARRLTLLAADYRRAAANEPA